MTQHGDHEVNYLYPSWQETQPAVAVFLAKLRGEEVEINCLIHCGYVVAGFGASMAFPHDHAPHGAEAGELKGQAALESLEEWDGKSRMAVDWISIVTFVLPLILKWIKDRR